jgi:hypothetical protein
VTIDLAESSWNFAFYESALLRKLETLLAKLGCGCPHHSGREMFSQQPVSDLIKLLPRINRRRQQQ